MEEEIAVQLWAYDSAGESWVRVQVNADGELVLVTE